MMSFECKECGESYKNRRSLHAHIKKHKMLIGDYYVKHYQRRDKLTGELLPFKKVDDYFKRDFSHLANFEKWICVASRNEVSDYLIKILKRRIDEKDLNYGPCDLELRSAGLPSVDVYKEFFGSYTEACKKCNVMPLLGMPLRNNEFFQDFSQEHILIDTRERKPLVFENSSQMKLDVGDYSVLPEKFDYTFVDRKSLPDLVNTLSTCMDRFKRELDRCRQMGCYLFVVVESDYEDIRFWNRKLYHKSDLRFIFACIREIQREYYDCCQFVFSGNRGYSTVLIPKLLCLGRRVHNVDIHYFWNKMVQKKKEEKCGK